MRKYLNQSYLQFFELTILIGLFTTEFSYSQPRTLSGPTTGEYSSNESITLLPGFSTSGPFRAFIIDGLSVKLGLSPSVDQNYIVAEIYKRASLTVFSDPSVSEVNGVVQYFDGLGRPLQTTQVKGAPGASKDIIQAFGYDDSGRETKKYLPYASVSNNGSFKQDALSSGAGLFNFYAPTGSSGNQLTNGIPRIVTPYAETRFEASPANRPVEQGNPGDTWQLTGGHTLKTEYLSNELNEVRRYTPGLNPGDPYYKRFLSPAGVYSANELFKTVVKDENWQPSNGKTGTTEEYKNKDGQVVLRRTYNMKDGVLETLSTMYIYDDYGNLCFVLTPESAPDGAGVSPNLPYSIAQDKVDALCYQYRYDNKNRLIEKKLPGKEWEYLVYDKLDRVVGSQDPLQRAKNKQEWTVTKYDMFGRVILNGIYVYPSGTANTNYRSVLQDTLDVQTKYWESRIATGNGYTSSSWPATGISTILVLNYYDNYNIPGLPVSVPYNLSDSYSKMTKSMVTASKINVLGTEHMLWNVKYYDDEARIVRNIQQHYKGSQTGSNNYDDIINVYNFASELTASTRRHYVNGTEQLYLANRYTYDHQGRSKDVYQKTGDNATTANAEVLLSRMNYNDIGQLSSKQLYSTNSGASFVQTVTYSYNSRGWLQSQSAPLFTQNLKYDEVINGTIPQYNGNISRQEWGTGKYYNYSYDKLNRLKLAKSDDNNNEEVGYDLVGNITRLKRHQANTIVDQLKYNYNGNKLTSVLDSNVLNTNAAFQLPGSTDYAYDLNGNIISRSNPVATNNLSISYNQLNLPTAINANGALITYTYDATGNKLKKVVTGNANLSNEYISGIQYEDGSLKFVSTAEGRVVRNSSDNYTYEYTLADHLGNGRVYFDINAGVARKIQEMDYYAFGLSISKSVSGTENKYQYNGKEKQDQEKMYDYGARFYDPVIGRFSTVDPLSETSRRLSPYSYALNNPIRFIDVDGMYAASPIYGRNGDFLGTDDEGLKGQAIVMKKEDFSQGMSHEEAKSKSTYKEGDSNFGFADEKAALKYANHYVNLKNRPDYDGKLTLGEANEWYRTADGKPLFVDASKIDLAPVYQGDLSAGDSKYVNFASPGNANFETGLVYGTIKLTLVGGNKVKLGGDNSVLDTYDFDYQKGRTGRNVATWMGKTVAGEGTGYTIYNYGTALLQKRPK